MKIDWLTIPLALLPTKTRLLTNPFRTRFYGRPKLPPSHCRSFFPPIPVAADNKGRKTTRSGNNVRGAISEKSGSVPSLIAPIHNKRDEEEANPKQVTATDCAGGKRRATSRKVSSFIHYKYLHPNFLVPRGSGMQSAGNTKKVHI